MNNNNNNDDDDDDDEEEEEEDTITTAIADNAKQDHTPSLDLRSIRPPPTGRKVGQAGSRCFECEPRLASHAVDRPVVAALSASLGLPVMPWTGR